ncbi:aminotransferase class V-fold PLP-dependent enzyme [Alteromonas hispanica]|uniref:Aminotransferase class V-fold PLP-dependent enzyme n=1 Tax=Alteromonas hispanica TaxID=315421 RepID=A0A6L9MXQ5_9ALTE|nr:aminotransferase class V-fold PLP-dependent enzyme [Alteromonas hispanica]NDW22946.1 aminotransferase class V-fold PLP-dependent enzyme [Alteromonas hispanica]
MAYQQFYTGFLEANEGKQQYTCHSHYFWPDCTKDAMIEYWDDSARYVDAKWGYFFETLVPELQRKISRIIDTSLPEQIVFASNTHELLYRIMSCLDLSDAITVVSTDSEFHSFQRQITRLAEHDNINIVSVPTQPFDSFNERFKAAISAHQPNLVFFSHVFFNSGYVVEDLDGIVESVENEDTLIVIDGYHGFMAKTTSLRNIEQRAFYLSGSYKYAQAGEGACFAHIPNGCTLRPRYTGWFAEFGTLDKPRSGEVQYSTDGMRFAGATMDFTALYRLRAVLRLFDKNNLSVEAIDKHVMAIQRHFLSKLDNCDHQQLTRKALVVSDETRRGHFLTFELGSAEETAQLANALKAHNILTDYRGSRLRFGFGLYHTPEYIDLSALAKHSSKI